MSWLFSSTPMCNFRREERTVAGFNLHVSIPIQGDDRRGLERQLQYMGRPPLSEQRLSKTSDGKLVVKLKTPWSDGTCFIVMQPLEFMERLVALVPSPRKNQIRYSGVFAPNAKLREKIVPQKEEAQGTMPAEECRHPSSRKRMGWAKLLSRVFQIDILACPRCQSKMQIISFITEPAVIKNILTSLKMATAPPEPARSSFVSQQTDFVYDYDYSESI